MKRAIPGIAFLAAGLSVETLAGQGLPPEPTPVMRIGISGGLGVSYINAVDIVNRINANPGVSDRVADFSSAVEFFGSASFPLEGDWCAKVEYAYLLSSFSATSIFPGSEFSVDVHMPTVIGQYALVREETYNVKAGFGLGYHFGTYTERYSTVDSKFKGSGVGAKLDLEANTAFGEDLFAYLGGDLRWEFIGELSDPSNPLANVGILPTLHFFSVGAKLGFTYYF